MAAFVVCENEPIFPGCWEMSTVVPFWFELEHRETSRAAGERGLIAGRVLPPAGLSHIRWRHWVRWIAKPVYPKFTECIDPLVSVVQNRFWIRSLKIDPEGSRPPCDRLAGIQYHRSATFPAQGESCQKRPRCTTPSWLRLKHGEMGLERVGWVS